MNKISRVLVANRGEIAIRIMRACKDLGIETVAAVSEADRGSLPAKMADRTVCIGPPKAVDSYLRVKTLVTAALGTGSDAIHPGYGFLAKSNAQFVERIVSIAREYGREVATPTDARRLLSLAK
jgi:acetyl-CoA carboxylase biotin carboxylase subunit